MRQNPFEKHPRLTLTCFTVAVLIGFAALAEIALRLTVSYDIGYYTAVQKEGVYHYPYGDIRINSELYPDSEFNLASQKPRIGYLGDSIIMGVGAGDNYRISDLLEQRYSSYEHWTFGIMGNGLREERLLDIVDQYKLKKIIYGYNLNDFLPHADARGQPVAGSQQTTSERTVHAVERFVGQNFDWLRGKSYLYTFARTGVKNILQSRGYGHTGFKAIEFYPSEHEDSIRDIAERFNTMADTLSREGVDLCLVIFPYEMQISKTAAETYRRKGIAWEPGFENGTTQELFKKHLKIPHVYDAREAFENVPDSAPGTYFVYDRGDKIDFNHLNRAGHQRVTEGLIASKTCVF